MSYYKVSTRSGNTQGSRVFYRRDIFIKVKIFFGLLHQYFDIKRVLTFHLFRVVFFTKFGIKSPVFLFGKFLYFIKEKKVFPKYEIQFWSNSNVYAIT